MLIEDIAVGRCTEGGQEEMYGSIPMNDELRLFQMVEGKSGVSFGVAV